VSPGGTPYDTDLQKSCKTINRYLEIVKKGGVIVLAAECINGIGEEAFYDWTINMNDLRRIERNLMRDFVFGGYTAYLLKRAFQRIHIVLVSILPDQIVKAFNLKCAKSINDGLRIAFDIVGDRAKVMVLPKGSTTFPYIEN
jgi:nickel-dependent lactate racemase